jgi:hypothetical protein
MLYLHFSVSDKLVFEEYKQQVEQGIQAVDMFAYEFVEVERGYKLVFGEEGAHYL